VIHRAIFVNRPGCQLSNLGMRSVCQFFALRILICLFLVNPLHVLNSVGWGQETAPALAETQYYRQAIEKLGPPSELVWSEPGDQSLNRWRARSLIEIKAVVLSWDADKLVVVKPQGNGPTTLPGDLLVGIEPSWKFPEYSQVEVLYQERKYREVLQRGQVALAMPEVPRWQQRLLVAMMVDAAVGLKQYGVAGKVFKVLAVESPPELLLSRIPLPWSDELIEVTPALSQEALGWMESDLPAMQLLGAAWLLGGEQRLAAIEKLKSLASGGTGLVQEYSKVQLWRLALPEEILSEKVSSWILQRDSLAVAYQAGPTMLLAHRFEQANQPKLAIAEWLRVASMHSDRYHLATQAVSRGNRAAKGTGEESFARQVASSFSSIENIDSQLPAKP